MEGADEIRLLAIDQAKTTGYALFDNGALIDYGAVEIGRKSDIYENILLSARTKLNELLHRMNADLVVIEDIQQQNQNVSTYKKLAMLMGVLLCLFQENGIAYGLGRRRLRATVSAYCAHTLLHPPAQRQQIRTL